MTRMAVYGAGGVGGYVGARLARAGAEVNFIARGAHLQALREHGLMVRSVKGDFHLRYRRCRGPAGAASGAGTAVVSLQNGVENEEKLARAVGEDHVMGGAAYIFAGIAEPGVIVQRRAGQHHVRGAGRPHQPVGTAPAGLV
jgi:2-dehydropantoate 2-reductase